MIETKELGGGSYPSAFELDEYKCYKFKTLAVVEIEGYLYVRNGENINEKIEDVKNWEEVENSRIVEIVDIVDVCVEED